MPFTHPIYSLHPTYRQAHDYLLMVSDSIDKDEVDALARSLLSYLSHYNQEHKVGGKWFAAPCSILCTEIVCAVLWRARANAPAPSTLTHTHTCSCRFLPPQLLEEYEADPSAWAWPGPTRATAIVACLPAFMDASGYSTGGAAPMQRGSSLATTQHVDPAAASVAGAPRLCCAALHVGGCWWAGYREVV